MFVPHTNNNHRARLLQLPGILVLIAFVFLYQNAINLTGTLDLGVLGYASQIPPAEVIRLSNDKRLQAGLPALSENPLLVAAARAKGLDMLEKDYWAHVSPDGTEPWYFFETAGYEYRYAGENLARDFSNPTAAVDAWMASPTHRDNLLSDKYSEIGVAVVEGELAGVETTLVVQLFGTKAGTQPAVPVASAQNEESQVASEVVPLVVPIAQNEPVLVVPYEPDYNEPALETAEAEPETIPVDAMDLDSGVTLSAASEISQVVISPLNLTKIVSVSLVSIFLVVLIIDAIIVSHKGIARTTGRSLAHVSFMGMILMVVLIAKAGQIF